MEEKEEIEKKVENNTETLEKNEEIPEKKEELKNINKKRQIIIETDGNNIEVIKAEVSGTIEMIGILQNLINFISKVKNNDTK